MARHSFSENGSLLNLDMEENVVNLEKLSFRPTLYERVQ